MRGAGKAMDGGMLARVRRIMRENRRLIIMVFQLFWIVVAILWRVSSDTPQSIPGFVYVNF
jgi:hypothetical protein